MWGGQEKPKASAMRSDSYNATLALYGLSFIIPLEANCDQGYYTRRSISFAYCHQLQNGQWHNTWRRKKILCHFHKSNNQNKYNLPLFAV